MDDFAEPAGHEDRYQERYVAFLDILGFAELVRGADRSAERRQEIVDALRSARGERYEEARIKVHFFSDSIILSAEHTGGGLWVLVGTLYSLAWNLLQIGVLVRGAIAAGNVYHDEDIVFGVGVNEAYRLESTVARFPRIILSKQVARDAQQYAANEEDRVILLWKHGLPWKVIRDYDGIYFVSLLSELFAYLADERASRAEKAEFATMGRRIQQVIQQKLDETLDSPEVYRKIEWLANYWNSSIEANSDGISEAGLEKVSMPGSALTLPVPRLKIGL
jgi:hypothetical protein